jgi:deoxyribodipyrimidine photo-lyase
MPSQLLWFRRDLRLCDHPALLAAAADDHQVVPLFVIDPALWDPSGPPRQAWLVRSLSALSAACDGRLVIRFGNPVDVVPAVAAEAGAGTVFVSADSGPYGRTRDAAVAGALSAAGRTLARVGTPYAIGPGTIRNGSGDPYKVFTPFSRAWREHGWPAPADPADAVRWAKRVPSEKLPAEPDLGRMRLPEAGEQAARERWQEFIETGVQDYQERRDQPGVDGTSGLSVHLKYGEVHPRTLLADLAQRRGPGVETFRGELCWREFYADVLWHRPATAREYLRPEYARMRYEKPGEAFEAWCQGRTGFPMVDAGMRQLLAEGWIHNRVRMIVASFLVKDLHVEWQHGARWFMRWLRDGDLASNQHGWQWVAGSGTDAAPYFRVFNPITQGLKFDPDGVYVRRYVPELAGLAGGLAHEPWKNPAGLPVGYPERIVDHAAERLEALARLKELKTPS